MWLDESPARRCVDPEPPVPPRVVAIGGGTGLSVTLSGLKNALFGNQSALCNAKDCIGMFGSFLAKKAGITKLQKLKLYNGKSIPGFTEDSIKELKEEAPREGMQGISSFLQAFCTSTS